MAAEKQTGKTILARNLIALRKAQRLTQAQVADILKIKRSTYAYYERDITPTVDNIVKLATLFATSISFLLTGKHETEANIIDRPGLGDGTIEEKIQQIKLKELSKDEALLIGYYRLISSQNKEKIHKEVRDLLDKSF